MVDLQLMASLDLGKELLAQEEVARIAIHLVARLGEWLDLPAGELGS